MALSAGTRLGPYEILAPIGAGGMGEVYRARDTKLDRDVAIKILPDALARDPERLARFEREAKVLASLNHPNIASIYGVEDRALIMELVEGETLTSPLPIQTALEYARQIAEALEYAHERGVIHRYLKPANIKVTPEGVVKLLDFGLAKAIEDPVVSTLDPDQSPTLTLGATRLGLILGTAAYMSPEQANGKPAHRRADIWSFGAVLYEMLAGKRAFAGESVSDTLASVLKLDPDWDAMPAAVPTSIRRLVRRCLNKDRKQRLQAIGEARIAIDEALSGASQETDAVRITAQKRNLVLGAVAAVLAIIGIAGWAAWWRATRPVDHPLMRLSVDLGPDAVVGQFTTVAISPDGARLVYPVKNPEGKQVLAMRLLNEANQTLLSGTENGRDPFFSPEGKWIGFFSNGKMKKISIQGGAPVILCDAPTARGASWGEDGNILVALTLATTLSRVPAAEGGRPQAVTKMQGSALNHRWPQPLPGGESVLFTLSASSVAFEDASIAAASLKTGEIKVLVSRGYFGRYLPTGDATGHLVYVHEGVLFAVPFDAARLELRGTPVPLLEDLAGDPGSGAGQFSFSRTGTFTYRTGKVSAQNYPVSWLDSSGKTQSLIAAPGVYLTPRFSPDGHRLALTQVAAGKYALLVFDLQREHLLRLALDTDIQGPSYPTWTPDGRHIVFHFSSGSGFGLGWIRADGAGDFQRLLETKNSVVPFSFFPDGRRLAYAELDSDSRYHIWTLALDVGDPDHPKPSKPELFLRTPSNESYPAFSPDGRWIAYQSPESGTAEVWVRPFPGPGGKWQISNAGGQLPVWSRNGRELFFQSPDSRIMVVDYTAKGDSFIQGEPRLWSKQQLQYSGGNPNYDLAPNGKQFAVFPKVNIPAEENGAVHIAFLLNFFDELRRRAPVGK
jgi:Tol biopolymer transport system component